MVNNNWKYNKKFFLKLKISTNLRNYQNKWKNKNNKFNLTKKFVYIKFYKYLNEIKNLTKSYCKKYDSLKKKLNLNRKKKIVYHKKAIYYHKNALEGGILKILNWKEKKDLFNFRYSENFKDKEIYEFWNLESSYFKNIYSLINRKHPYKHIYNLAYRALLIFPFSIKVKPYTVILKNYFIKNFLFIFEWRSKLKKDAIILKIIKKYNKIIKYKFIKILNFNSFEIFKRLYINKFKRIYKDNSLNIISLLKIKIKYLYWKCENWLWRYRNNWKFTIEHKEISLNYQYYLLKAFKLNVLKKYKLHTLPKKVFIEKFFNLIFLKLLKKRKNNNLIRKFFSFKYNKLKFFKFKNYYLKNNTKILNNFLFSKMYSLYYYWLLFIISKIYNYLNKIIFNSYVNFLYITDNLNLNKNFSFLFFNNLYKNLINKGYKMKLNIESNIGRIYLILNLNRFYLNKYYIPYNYTRPDIITYFNRNNNTRLDTLFFKNLQLVYTSKFHNIVENNCKFLLDYIDNYQYSIFISFKKYIIQTNRFINFNLYRKINKLILKNRDINDESNINISNNIYVSNLEFLKISHDNLNLDKIKFRKMSFNHKVLGFNSNINDICYKNFELFESDDKRFYYI
jgi:hypothetical protein